MSITSSCITNTSHLIVVHEGEDLATGYGWFSHKRRNLNVERLHLGDTPLYSFQNKARLYDVMVNSPQASMDPCAGLARIVWPPPV